MLNNGKIQEEEKRNLWAPKCFGFSFGAHFRNADSHCLFFIDIRQIEAGRTCFCSCKVILFWANMPGESERAFKHPLDRHDTA